jgi:ankyrin repeat protein
MNIYENILKPKSKQDIIKDLSKFTSEEKGIKLRIASFYGYINIVKLLIEAGADVNAKDLQGDSALMWASYNSQLDIIKLLIEAGTDVNAKDIYGNTTLECAYRNGYKEIVDLLKIYGAKE